VKALPGQYGNLGGERSIEKIPETTEFFGSKLGDIRLRVAKTASSSRPPAIGWDFTSSTDGYNERYIGTLGVAI
jgi:hypothetical protein